MSDGEWLYELLEREFNPLIEQMRCDHVFEGNRDECYFMASMKTLRSVSRQYPNELPTIKLKLIELLANEAPLEINTHAITRHIHAFTLHSTRGGRRTTRKCRKTRRSKRRC
jgi:hypothetical protein